MNRTAEEVGKNLQSVRERIALACSRCGRKPEEIRIMAVTKTFSADRVRSAYAAGLRLFGENRVQEAAAKYGPLLEDRQLPGLELHLVGHLQRNKAKKAAELFSCVQSIDKLETAQALERECSALGRSIDVLLELNTSGEETKFGFAGEEALLASLEPLAALKGPRLRGLMTVGPFTEDRLRIRAAFARLRVLFDKLKDRYPELAFDTLSMGMSADFEVAVEEGSTLLRLGTALFGAREPQ